MQASVVVIGCGQVGEAAARRLIECGLSPENLSLTVSRAESVARLSPLGAKVAVVDLDNVSELRQVLKGASSVLFSAAPGRGGSGQAVYVDGIANVLQALESPRDVHLVYTSSTGVYAERNGGWVDEDADLATDHSARADALLLAESQLTKAAADGMRLSVLRLSGLVGASRGPQNRLHFVSGVRREDGDSWLNLVHVSDVANVIATVFERGETGVFNVSSPTPLRRREFYDTLIRRAGVDPVEWIEAPEEADLGRRIDVSRLRDVLGQTLSDVDPNLLPLSGVR